MRGALLFYLFLSSAPSIRCLLEVLLEVFCALLKVFKLFSKNFWEAYPALTRGFSALFGSE